MEQTAAAPHRVSLHAGPIDVAAELRQALFGTVESVVLTSATLSIHDDPQFQYYRGRIGLENGRRLKLDSPYDFRTQVDVHIEADLPAPSDADEFGPAAYFAPRNHVCDIQQHAISRSERRLSKIHSLGANDVDLEMC